MTVMTDTVLILLSVVFLLFVGISIPCILQVWRTAKGLTLTLQILNENLPVIMKNLEEITTGVNRTTAVVHRQFEELSLVMKKMKGLLVLLVGVEEIIRRGVQLPYAPALRTCFAVSKGVRAFLGHLLGERREGG
jgi:hypothetical protein